MAPRRIFFGLAAGALLMAGCSDGVGPPPDPTPAMFSTSGTALNPLEHSVTLETYQVSFWAVRGQKRAVEIKYRDLPQGVVGGASDLPKHGMFLRFEVPAYSLYARRDGSRIATGDSVRITITVDSRYLILDFQPSGLTFMGSDPSILEVWYGGAKQDLDGDGDVDAADDLLARLRLSFWHRRVGGNWELHPTLHARSDKYLLGQLKSFSGYAVSW